MARSTHTATLIALALLAVDADARPGGRIPAAVAGVGGDEPLAGRIAALKRAFDANDEAMSGKLAAARKAGAKGGSAEIRALVGAHSRAWQAIADKVAALVRDHPGDPAALDGLLLLGVFLDDDLVEIARAYSPDDPRIGRLCASLADRTLDSSRALLEEVAARSHDRQVRGRATYALGAFSSNLCKQATSTLKQTAAERQEVYAEPQRRLLDRMFEGRTLTAPEQDRLLGDAREQFERVVKDYPDVPSADGTSRLADKAKAGLEWVANLPGLKVGKVAPAILGEDLDGRPLDLGAYRGKVVVLCFWATWCGPCMAMVPHERELARRMEGKPFALVGVNSDEADQRGKAKKAALDERMTWPSFWDGGVGGPIQMRYNVDHYPTTYVLDPEGRIRAIDLRGEDLDRAVDGLLIGPKTGAKLDAAR